MTLREYGRSIAEWWDRYLTEITTQHVLDWSIWHLVLTFFGVIVAFAIAWALIEIAFTSLVHGWKKCGIPAAMDRLDQRFGPYATGVIVVVVHRILPAAGPAG